MFRFLDLKTEMFGIDISDCAVKVLKLRKRGKFLKVDFLNEVDFDLGIVDAGVIKNEQALIEIIKKSLISPSGKKLKIKNIIASLPEEKSFLEVIQMPKMSEEELKTAVLYQAENYIPLPLDQMYLDFSVLDMPNKDNSHLDVLVVAMPKNIIDSYMFCFKKAGLIPIVLEVESQAIVRSLVKNEESNCPLILINYGKKNSNIIIFSGKSIRFTSSISASSSQITEAISKSLNISLDEAEKIKINYSLLKKDENEDSKKIYNTISPVLNDLVAQIKKYIAFYKDHVSHDHINLNNLKPEDNLDILKEKIIITGGGSNLKGLAEFFSENIGIKSEVGDVFANINFKRNKLNPIKDEKKSSLCTVIGLALRGVDKNECRKFKD